MEVKYGNPSIESIHDCITDVAGKNPDSFFEKLEEKEGLSPFVKNYVLGSFFPRMLTFSARAPESKDGIPFIPESPTKDFILYNAASSILLDILPHLYSILPVDEVKKKIPEFLAGKFKSDSGVKSLKAAFKILESLKKSLSAHFDFTDSDFSRLNIAIENALKAGKNDFEAYFKILDTFDYRNVKAQTADFILDSFTKKFVYKEEPSEKYFAQIEESLPHCSAFFIPYLKGFEAVASLDFSAAEDFFTEAGKNLSFAGDWTSDFLRQAVALFLYDKKEEKAQKFIEAGEEVGIFAQNSKVFAVESAHRDFYIQFNLKMFKDFAKVRVRALKDVKILYTDKIREAVDTGDLKKLKTVCPPEKIDSVRIEGVSLLYYAIQRKGVVKQGAEAFTQNLVASETDRSFRSIDLSKFSLEERRAAALKIQHSMRDTYEKSGLGNLFFESSCGSEKEIPALLKKLEALIAYIAENAGDVDSFTRQIEGSFGTNALALAAEMDDAQSAKILLNRGASPSRQNGSAPFGMNYSDGSKISVELPNNFLYRLISFKSFVTLKVFLTEFTELARPMMTETSKKSNITPLVYLILTQIYAAATKEEYDANSKIVNELIPLFEASGAKIRQQTAFGSAEKLLGMKH